MIPFASCTWVCTACGIALVFFGLTSQDFGLSSIVAKGKVRKPALELRNHMHPNFKQANFSTCHTISKPASVHKKRAETDSKYILNGGVEYVYITGWQDILQSHIPLQCHLAKYSALVAPNIRRLCQPKLEHPTMWHRRPVGWLTSRFEEPFLIYFATWLTGFPTSRSQVLQGNYDHSCDIWSCGVIMWRAQWIGNEALSGPVYLRMHRIPWIQQTLSLNQKGITLSRPVEVSLDLAMKI